MTSRTASLLSDQKSRPRKVSLSILKKSVSKSILVLSLKIPQLLSQQSKTIVLFLQHRHSYYQLLYLLQITISDKTIFPFSNEFFLLPSQQVPPCFLATIDFSSVHSAKVVGTGQATDEVVQPLFPLFPTVHGHIGN